MRDSDGSLFSTIIIINNIIDSIIVPSTIRAQSLLVIIVAITDGNTEQQEDGYRNFRFCFTIGMYREG